MTVTNVTQANADQAKLWNDEAGPRWVESQRDLDAELEQFGVAIADWLELAPGERVLDVGSGAGTTSLMLAERARPGDVLGVDISRPLMERARERASGVPNLRFELGDAQTFAFPRGAFDVVYSRFGVMFFADPTAAFANIRTALRAGGRLGFVCWRAMSENPVFTVPLDAALPFLPEPPKASDPDAPGPFAFASADGVRRILEGAGWTEIETARHDSELVMAGRNDLEAAVDLALRFGPVGRALRTVPEGVHAEVRAAIRAAFAAHHGPLGVTFPAATWLVKARSP